MPDRITYSTLIKGFCTHGDLPKAMALMKSMKEQGLAPDAIIYNTVMDGCVGKDKFSLCDELYESMKKEGVKATDYTLTVLIKRFGRDAKLNKAFELVNTFPQMYNVRPSVAALACSDMSSFRVQVEFLLLHSLADAFSCRLVLFSEGASYVL